MDKLQQHSSVKHARLVEAERLDGTVLRHVVVHTGLVLDPSRDGYDKAAHDDLMAAIHALLDRHPDIDGADVEGA